MCVGALQEEYSSPRILYFSEYEIMCQCRTDVKCKCCTRDNNDVFGKVEFNAAISDSPSHVVRDKKDVWKDLASQFSAVRLTKSSDRLPKFSGLAKVAQTFMKSRHLAGSWENDIVSSLTWFGQYGPIEKQPEPYRAPTWSWASIEGPVCWPDTCYELCGNT